MKIIENGDGVEIPAEIAELCGTDAPAYLIVDPKEGGSAHSRALAQQQVRESYKKRGIIFTGHFKLADGHVVYVGQKIDPLIAEIDLTRSVTGETK